MSVSRLPTASAGRGGLPSSVLTIVYCFSAPALLFTAWISDFGMLCSGSTLPEPRGPRALELPWPKICLSSLPGLSATIQYTPLPPLANCATRFVQPRAGVDRPLRAARAALRLGALVRHVLGDGETAGRLVGRSLLLGVEQAVPDLAR